MKSYLKLTLTLISILLVLKISFAQGSLLLIKGGIQNYSFSGENITILNDSTLLEDLGLIGFQLGYNYEYSFAKKQSLLVGLEFSRRKFKDYPSRALHPPVFFYMGVPVSYNFEILKNLKPKLGFKVDYLLKKYQFNYFRNFFESEVSGRFLNYDLGLSYGLRYQIWNLDFEFNGVYGLVDILEVKSTNASARSRYLSFSCSYVID